MCFNIYFYQAFFSKNPPLCWFWNNCEGSYFFAIVFNFCTFAAPYPAIGFWSREASFVKMNGMSRPRCLLCCFHASVTAMGTARTAASSAGFLQSTSVVHPDGRLVFRCHTGGAVRAGLTLVRLLRDAHRVSTSGVAGCSHAGDHGLQDKGHVRARAGVHGCRLFLPHGVDVLVELGVDVGADTAVVMTGSGLAMRYARDIGVNLPHGLRGGGGCKNLGEGFDGAVCRGNGHGERRRELVEGGENAGWDGGLGVKQAKGDGVEANDHGDGGLCVGRSGLLPLGEGVDAGIGVVGAVSRDRVPDVVNRDGVHLVLCNDAWNSVSAASFLAEVETYRSWDLHP